MLRKVFSFLPFFLFLLANAITAQVSVTTQHNDLLRSGWNNRETKLTPSNVNARQFGALFKVLVDDQMYAQPLVVANVTIAGASHNVVYAATVNNTVYAADGDNGTLYWSKNYTPASQRPPKASDMTGACGGGGNYRDFSGNIGIVGTPVIDSASQTLYFVARSVNSSNQFYQYLHAVDIRTGAEKSGSPVLITASVPGAGDGNVNFMIPFDAQHNNQRQPLTLAKGLVYITFSSHCDWIPYHGWVLGYDQTTLQQKSVYNVTPDGYNGGLWESGGGPVVDGNNMYLVTGNGSIGSGSNQSDVRQRSESAIQLNIASPSAITITDFFTPKNYDALEAADLDYGSMAAFLIPNTNLYLTGCKDGNLYLLDTANLGGFSKTTNNVKQTIALGSNVTLRCQPSYYRSAAKEFVYVWSENSQMKAYPVNRTAGNLDVSNLVTGTVAGPSGQNGTVLSTSSNNSIDGTGIVWASYAYSGDANQSVRPGVLRAFNANDITQELWNSNQNVTRDAPGNYAKFSAPTVANGKVYLPTFSNQLVAYGIVDTSVQGTCTGSNLALNQPAYASSVEAGSNHPASAATDGNDTTRWASELYVDPEWIYVDLGKRDSICNVTLKWEWALAQDFQVQVSDNASIWTPVSTITGNTAYTNSINLKAAGRYVRMYGTKRGSPYGYSLYEFQVFGAPIQSCATPSGITVNSIDTASAVIRWNKVSGAASYNVQYKLSSSTVWTTSNTKADTLKLTGLSCGNYYNYRVQTVCSGSDTSNYSAFGSFNTISCSDCGFLPTRIYTSDIGNVGVGGQACFTAPNIYRLKGSGRDVGGTADAFRFVYKTFTGDGTVEARVTTQDSTNKLNKAGVMFRKSLDANSPNVFMAITSASGAVYQARKVGGGNTSGSSKADIKAPYSVRIVKSGTTYTSYISSNGIRWVQLNSVSIPKMGNNGTAIYAGLAVTSHDNSKASTATFKNFEIDLDSATEAKEDYEGDFFVQKNIELQQLMDNMKLSVYPNPASRNFSISFSVRNPQPVSVNILGLSDGKVYYQESMTNFSGSYRKDNATFRLSNGSYIIFIKTSEGTLSKTLLLEK